MSEKYEISEWELEVRKGILETLGFDKFDDGSYNWHRLSTYGFFIVEIKENELKEVINFEKYLSEKMNLAIVNVSLGARNILKI